MRNVRERRFTDFFSQYYMQHEIRPSHTIFNLDLHINTFSPCVILLVSYFVLFACFGFVCFKKRENIKLGR